MDWGKAKNILIVIFVALNIFLCINLWGFYFGESISRETISNAATVLKSRGITLKCGIPRSIPDDIKLEFKRGGYDTVKIVSRLLDMKIPADDMIVGVKLKNGSRILTFNSKNSFVYMNTDPTGNVNVPDKSEAEKYARKFINRLGLPFQGYQLDVFTKDGDDSVKLCFVEKYENLLVFTNRIDINISKKGVTYLESTFVSVKQLLKVQNPSKKITPAYLILVKNLNDGNNIIITGINIGYIGPDGKKDTASLSGNLVWRVKVQREKDLYFNAYSGVKIG